MSNDVFICDLCGAICSDEPLYNCACGNCYCEDCCEKVNVVYDSNYNDFSCDLCKFLHQ